MFHTNVHTNMIIFIYLYIYSIKTHPIESFGRTIGMPDTLVPFLPLTRTTLYAYYKKVTL